MNLYKFIVIYNTYIVNNSLQNFEHIIFIDNSTDEEIKKSNVLHSSLNKDKFLYLDMNGNKGLSKAYNAAIKLINFKNDDYILILDQDTVYNSNTFEQYENFIKQNSFVDVVCPIVEDSIGVMSPCFVSHLKYTHIKNKNIINKSNINNFSFINSGLCIKGSVFSTIKYDESLFLDFVDHDFIRQIHQNNFSIAICSDIVLSQNFSGVTKNSFNQDYNRFKIYIKDAKNYYEKYFPRKKIKNVLFPRTLKLTLIHRKINFIKELMNLS